MSETADRIRSLMDRHEWSQGDVSAYLGVPQPTISNWLKPEDHHNYRSPGVVVARLLDVFERLEMLAPSIHATFVPPARDRK